MRLQEKNKEVEVSEDNLPLLLDLLKKWGYEDGQTNIKDLDKMTLELNAWGIPCKRIKWDC